MYTDRPEPPIAQALERAWQELAPLEPRLEHDADAAEAWLELLRLTPGRATLVSEGQRILSRFGGEAALVTRACGALIRAAELTPGDEPLPEHTRAELAAQAAANCLASLDASRDRELRA